MSQHDSSVRFRHMLDCAREATAFVRGRTRADLDNDRLLSLSLARLLEIIGEAANRVPVEERSLRPEIPWSQIISMRNRLIHGYDAVDLDILWEIVTTDLLPLIKALEEIAAALR